MTSEDTVEIDRSPETDGGDEAESTENGEGLEGGEEEESSGKKKLLLVLVPLILLIGGGAGLYFSGVLGGESEEQTVEGEHGEDGEEVAAEGEHGEDGAEAASIHFLPIPDIIVNLSSKKGKPRFLRLSVQLELENEADKAAVEAVMPRVIDQFQTYLRELRVEDLQGSAGIYRLQMELLFRVNNAAHPVEVKDVLFQEILIQ